ncbi:hypothetical protein [Thioclava sp. GXIMD4216]|uniref:hypothetical protein n=1 Tax=Thioclava sp. GXIMD4216 TaxID=3131929 RepID=UPI0030CEAAA6
MRRVAVLCLCLAGLVLGGGVAYAAPEIGLYLCPRCYGYRPVAPHVYADGQASDAQIRSALDNLEGASARVRGVYPDLASDPEWLLCLSEACNLSVRTGPRAMAYLDRFVFVTGRGTSVTILAHELAHAELHHRVGAFHFLTGAVPAWFDEGLAVYISRDTRYLSLREGRILGCDDAGRISPPADAGDFRRRAATESHALYTASACKVMDWLARHGGLQGVIAMEASLRRGGQFLP